MSPTFRNEGWTSQTSLSGKDRLRIGLGILWLIDAVLQMQPGMFHPAFYGNLDKSLMPSLLQTVEESTVSWAVPAVQFTQALYIHAPVMTNLFVIVVQLCLAAFLLLPKLHPFIRIAAWGTVIWSLCVWVFGEGLGGFLSPGDMTFYAGFPGSALLYAIGGLFLLMPDSKWATGWAGRTLRSSIALLVGLSALLQVLPFNQQWDKATLMSVFANSGFQPQPGVLSKPVMSFTMWIANHTAAANWTLVLLLVMAAVALLYWDRANSWVRLLFYLWVFSSWWFGMDFGYLFSGLSTDLNTAPVVALLVYATGRVQRTKIAPMGY